MRDQREVSLLSHRMILQSVSLSLQKSFRLLPPPVPAALSVYLAVYFPFRESVGLTTFRIGILMG